MYNTRKLIVFRLIGMMAGGMKSPRVYLSLVTRCILLRILLTSFFPFFPFGIVCFLITADIEATGNSLWLAVLFRL